MKQLERSSNASAHPSSSFFNSDRQKSHSELTNQVNDTDQLFPKSTESEGDLT